MRKIIFIAILVSISSLTSAQKYVKLYQKGIKLYQKEKYIEADSLLTLAIKMIPDDISNTNLFFDRGVIRLQLSDTCGFCTDMKMAADLNDINAKANYEKFCLKCNEEAYEFYNRSHQEFLLNNYSVADSLISLSTESYEFVDNIYLRGIIKLHILDTSEYCSDMEKISDLNEQESKRYQQLCKNEKSIEYIQQPCSCADDSLKNAYEDEVFFVVENMPKFNGKRSDAFRIFIQQNLRYPTEALLNGVTGRVFVSFDICKDGQLRNAKIVRSAGKHLDNEVLRILSISPKWSPGLQRNEPVIVRFTFPILFQMQMGK